MRAFEGDSLSGVDAFRMVGRERPEPAAGEVRIQVEATALGYVDGLIIHGRYQLKPPLPYVPGGEIAGVVDAVGAGVSEFCKGDRVAAWPLGGGLADFCLASVDDIERFPAKLDSASAAAMLVDYPTAHYALFERGALRAGETVLVMGASGGVGSAAVQLAAKAGAYVIAAASTPDKREAARALGAQAVIDSASADIRAVIRAAAPGGVADVVVDPVGGATFEALFRSLGKEGRHLVIGFAGGIIPSLPANLPLLKSASLVGVDVRHFVAAHPEEARRARNSLFGRVASGALLKPRIRAFALEQAREALEATLRRDKTGKIVVLPGTEKLGSPRS